jgi:hypothetical protein
MLSHEENEIRAIVFGGDDVLTFTRIHGTWISEELEPVAIEFEWQRRGNAPLAAIEDCICSKDLAAQLLQGLFAGCDSEATNATELFAFDQEGCRVPATLLELRVR